MRALVGATARFHQARLSVRHSAGAHALRRHVFGLVGAPRLCPETVCKRSGACRGGDGPPCYRADRDNLSQVLFLWWMRVYEDLSDEEYDEALRLKGSPYAPSAETAAGPHKDPRKRRRRGR